MPRFNSAPHQPQERETYSATERAAISAVQSSLLYRSAPPPPPAQPSPPPPPPFRPKLSSSDDLASFTAESIIRRMSGGGAPSARTVSPRSRRSTSVTRGFAPFEEARLRAEEIRRQELAESHRALLSQYSPPCPPLPPSEIYWLDKATGVRCVVSTTPTTSPTHHGSGGRSSSSSGSRGALPTIIPTLPSFQPPLRLSPSAVLRPATPPPSPPTKLQQTLFDLDALFSSTESALREGSSPKHLHRAAKHHQPAPLSSLSTTSAAAAVFKSTPPQPATSSASSHWQYSPPSPPVYPSHQQHAAAEGGGGAAASLPTPSFPLPALNNLPPLSPPPSSTYSDGNGNGFSHTPSGSGNSSSRSLLHYPPPLPPLPLTTASSSRLSALIEETRQQILDLKSTIAAAEKFNH